MKEREALNIARSILEQKGFSNIKFLGKPYDLEAEKDGFKIGIEVKTANIGFSGSWLQLKRLHFDHFLPKGHKALLMFVNEKGYHLIFQMTDAQTV